MSLTLVLYIQLFHLFQTNKCFYYFINFFLYQPSTLVSPTTVLRSQKGNCFDFSVLLCSLLIGAGYDAYCVCGYATRETTLTDETREICPLLKKKDEVSCLRNNAYVAVNFFSRVIFVFVSFLGMVMYAIEVETKEK